MVLELSSSSHKMKAKIVALISILTLIVIMRLLISPNEYDYGLLLMSFITISLSFIVTMLILDKALGLES